MSIDAPVCNGVCDLHHGIPVSLAFAGHGNVVGEGLTATEQPPGSHREGPEFKEAAAGPATVGEHMENQSNPAQVRPSNGWGFVDGDGFHAISHHKGNIHAPRRRPPSIRTLQRQNL
jgi:hypothetical protein